MRRRERMVSARRELGRTHPHPAPYARHGDPQRAQRYRSPARPRRQLHSARRPRAVLDWQGKSKTPATRSTISGNAGKRSSAAKNCSRPRGRRPKIGPRVTQIRRRPRPPRPLRAVKSRSREAVRRRRTDLTAMRHGVSPIRGRRLIPLSQVGQYLGLAGQIRNGAGFEFFGS
jgi:hypothetical protein